MDRKELVLKSLDRMAYHYQQEMSYTAANDQSIYNKLFAMKDLTEEYNFLVKHILLAIPEVGCSASKKQREDMERKQRAIKES